MARTIFRVLIGLTLLVMMIARYSRGRMQVMLFLPFYYWFLVSVFVFAAFGLASAYHAWREPHNRWSSYTIGDTFSEANRGLEWRDVGDIAAERGTDPFDTLLDIVLAAAWIPYWLTNFR